MLKIRLSRKGKKNRPTYRFVVSEHTKDTYSDVNEILGFYDPILKQINIKRDRIEYWLSVGAKPSASVNNILVSEGIIKDKKVPKSKLSRKRLEKIKAKDGEEKVEDAPKNEKAEAPKEDEPKEKENKEEAPKEKESKEDGKNNKSSKEDVSKEEKVEQAQEEDPSKKDKPEEKLDNKKEEKTEESNEKK